MIAKNKADQDKDGKLAGYISKLSILQNSIEMISIEAKTTSVNILTSLKATKQVRNKIVNLRKSKKLYSGSH